MRFSFAVVFLIAVTSALDEAATSRRIEELEAKLEAVMARLANLESENCCQNVTVLEAKMVEVETNLDNNGIEIVDLKLTQGHHSDQIYDLQVGLGNSTKQLRLELAETAANLQGELDDLIAHIEKTTPPVGTILGWVPRLQAEGSNDLEIPAGWQLCDGSVITAGPLEGKATPLLNDGRFLRGGTLDSVLTFEDDAVQDHAHMDPGHTHTDAGHGHGQDAHYHDYDNDQSDGYRLPTYVGVANCDDRDTGLTHDQGDYWCVQRQWNTAYAYANIHEAQASIQSAKTGVGMVEDGYRREAETRPKNMRVIYIIRVQ